MIMGIALFLLQCLDSCASLLRQFWKKCRRQENIANVIMYSCNLKSEQCLHRKETTGACIAHLVLVEVEEYHMKLNIFGALSEHQL